MEHKAKIISIKAGELELVFERGDACANCQIKSSCGMHSSAEQNIVVEEKNAANYAVGQMVELEIKEKDAARALFFAYILPLFLVLMTLMACWKITTDELKSGIYSLSILVPYYGILWFMGKKNCQNINIRIKKDFD